MTRNRAGACRIRHSVRLELTLFDAGVLFSETERAVASLEDAAAAVVDRTDPKVDRLLASAAACRRVLAMIEADDACRRGLAIRHAQVEG